MRQATTAIALAPLLPDWVPTSDINSVYKWHDDGVVLANGDFTPADYTGSRSSGEMSRLDAPGIELSTKTSCSGISEIAVISCRIS